MARGFSQKYGIDYEKTFAPATKMTSIVLLFLLFRPINGPYIRWMLRMPFLTVTYIR